mmetsp:Transcript_44502/g.115703  ORF Transcript_44502/g.115703 Transcript_44502/m.115703 type:complete len:206 (-) Transcript_44502:1827-2444(-)|eukprot:CAMPEP_0113902734 /NCGR_PEP_ID=MMETSP0780_2-20120614/22027_1 /TAXON_ID=652834 /ORGANISM="Palpitomonas bilix" /LENGTH=205 /DNA_ID=CAMNT_0000895597 /DNA_START=129 /DNA_END=746 /DNA_ORIENTATION=+ /assembly_acc=CAM_ASM_000599
MSIMEYNGGAVIGMVGKECVAIAADRRLGRNYLTVSTEFDRIFKVSDKCYVGFSGFATDAQTVADRLSFKHALYKLREERDMKPSVFSHVVSALLYEKRFGPYFTEPLIAGLEGPENKPVLSSLDLIGCEAYNDKFAVVGTASDQLLGVCESLFRPNMEPEDLFETVSQCLLAGVDRDCFSGWGGIVHIITKDKVITRKLKARMD